MSNPRLVLITGINGYIAAHTAATFLRAGYSVRGTVRARNPNVETLVNKLSEYHDGTKLELVEVPDISANGAFNRAVQGASTHLPPSLWSVVYRPGTDHHLCCQACKQLPTSPALCHWQRLIPDP